MGRSVLTTLCYLEQEGKYLMLHRVKKKQDVNAGKWIGVGGHFEEGESPEDCMKREIREETGLVPLAWRFRGIVTFLSDSAPAEYMHLYTVTQWQGELTDCDEGDLAWVEKGQIDRLNLWEGDRIFLRLLAEEAPFFSLKLTYRGDALTEAELDGRRYPDSTRGERGL